MRLAIFTTHPIQYHAPLWRYLARQTGIELKVFYFSDHSVRGGVDSEFAVPVSWDVPLLEGYEWEFLSRTADLANPRQVRIQDPELLLKRGGFEGVLLQGYTHGFERQLAAVARSLGVRVVLRGELTDHGPRPYWKHLVRTAFLRSFYRRIDAFAVIGEMARRHLARMGVSSERQYESPYAVDGQYLESQKSPGSRADARAAFGWDAGQFVFLFSGKLIERKRPLDLIHAVAKLPESARAALLVVGDGPLMAEAKDAGERLLGRRCRFAGFANQSQIAGHFACADALVLPSRFETWGLVVNEAFHFGLPAIVSDQVGCHPDLVIPGETGAVFPESDPRALLEALHVAAADPQRSAEMGKKAHERIRRFSVERAGSGVLQAFGAV